MQDKQIIPLFEKYSTITDSKLAFQTMEQIINRINQTDITFILDKIMSCLQSTDYNVTINYSLLLKALIEKFGQTSSQLTSKSIYDKLQSSLSKKKAYGKSEFKHFILTKYLVYSYLNLPNLITIILEDRKVEDSEYLAYILLKYMKQENVKQISNAIKNDLQNLTPRVFCILVKLQQLSQKGQFQWDKYLREQVFDQVKLLKLVNQSIDEFPKKQLFYEYLARYLSNISQKESTQITEVLNFLIEAKELKKHNYVLLKLFKNFVKLENFPLQLIKNQQLVQIWYKSIGNSNSIIKRLATKIEFHLSKRALSYEDTVFFRSIYGYRIHPKSLFAQNVFSKFGEQDIQNYLEQMKALQENETDPICKLHYLNEIFVLAQVGNLTIQQLTNVCIHIYFFHNNFDNIYEELDEENKEAYPQDELKKKVVDQCQSFFYSLVGKLATNIEEFNKFTKEILDQGQESDLIKKYKLINKKQPKDCIKHLVNAILLFSFFNKEEGLSILDEFENITVDLQDIEPKLKKKVKTDQNKAKVVLTEIFVQLLTKSPQFLRDAVNQCSKSLDFGVECLDLLLEVLQKEDHEYIQEMQQQEMVEEEGEIDESGDVDDDEEDDQ